MKKGISPTAMRWFWAAVIGLVTVGLVAGGYAYYCSEAHHIRQEQYQEIAAIADLKARQIQQWRKERLGDALKTVQSPFFREAVERWLRDPTDTGLQSALLERLRLELKAYGYTDALLVDTGGRILLSASARPDPVDAAAKRAIKSALAGRRPELSDLYRSPHGIIHLDAVAPILNDEGRLMATLLLNSSAEAFLYPLIQSWPTPSRTAETILVRRDDDNVLFLNNLRHQTNTALTLRYPLTRLTLPAVQAVFGREGIFQGSDYRNIEVLADLRPIPGTTWFMVAKVDIHEILAEARYRAWMITLIVTLSIMLLGGTIVYFYRSRQEAERRKGKEALYEVERRLHLFIEGVRDYAIYLLDAHGRVVSWNAGAERLKGYHSDEIVGQHYAKFFALEDQQSNKPQHLLAIAESEGRVKDEGWRVKKDGSAFWADTVITALKNEDGSLYGFAKITRDLTERKQAEEEVRKLNLELEQRVLDRTDQLETANRELEAFSYSVSHDLRAPLRAIDGFSRVVLEDCAEKLDDEGKRYLNVIRSNTQKMGQLIDDLLAFSRLGRQEIKVSDIDMGKLAKAVSAEMKLDSPKRKVRFTIKKLSRAQGDQPMIRQVFANLLSNAIKFTRPKDVATIEVGCSNEKNENVFYVKDNGVGFDMQYVNKLFGVFQRLHSSEEFEGTGVGLAIVQRIIHRHGGRVWAEGKVNGGAGFYFTLPQERRE